MDFDLSPKFSQLMYEEEGGLYYTWYSSQFPVLGEAKVGGGRLVLRPRGFVLPHYADSYKIGYVLQGTEGRVGLVFPNSSKEVVLKLKKGDLIPLPIGVLSWWYNSGDSDLVMVLLGANSSNSYVPGDFTYFLLSGGLNYLQGFSSEFTARAFKLNEEDANELVKSQKAVLLVEVEAGKKMPQPCTDSALVYNIDTSPPDINVIGGGLSKTITAAEFPFLKEIGLSVNHVKMDAYAMYSPTYTADNSARQVYVHKGRGTVQVVGIGGKQVLNSTIEDGQLLIVPGLFDMAIIAGYEGLEFFSTIKSLSPVVGELATKKSVWNAVSPVVMQVALGVSQEFEELLSSNIKKSDILLPPPK